MFKALNKVGRCFPLFSSVVRLASTSTASIVPRGKRVLTFQSSTDEPIIHPAFVTRVERTTFMNQPIKPCVSITTCEYYDLNKVKSSLSLNGLTPIQIVPNECILFKTINGSNIFIFKFGTIVSWDVPEVEVINDILPMFQDSMINSYKIQSEDLDYVDLNDIEKTSYVTSDEIICLNSDSENKLLDMLAFSYGISRSTRLAILEKSIEDHINLTRTTIEKLSNGEKLSVDSRSATKLSGRLLLLRGKLNLYSELVETPDIYWSETRLEKIHNKISNELDVPIRINVLNRKLDYLTDESHALVEILTHKTEKNLELIIIYLIVIEVCFELYHFYDHLGGTYNLSYFYKLLHGVEKS